MLGLTMLVRRFLNWLFPTRHEASGSRTVADVSSLAHEGGETPRRSGAIGYEQQNAFRAERPVQLVDPLSSQISAPLIEPFTGFWKPTTAGERLVHFLAVNASCFSQPPLAPHNTLEGIPRGLLFRDFVHGCLLLHAFARLSQAAKHYRSTLLDDDSKALNAIRQFALDNLELAPGTCRDFEDLPRLAFDCAASSSPSSSTPNSREKKKVIDACKGVYHCYSCGGLLDPLEKNLKAANYLTYDHLWPHSQGGDSREENLMIACQYCNRDKGDAVLWQWELIQSLIPITTFGEEVLAHKHLLRSQKMALHSKAVLSYAREFGTTLKDAYLSVGPRLADITIVNPNDTPDFFNLRNHDESRFASI